MLDLGIARDRCPRSCVPVVLAVLALLTRCWCSDKSVFLLTSTCNLRNGTSSFIAVAERGQFKVRLCVSSRGGRQQEIDQFNV